MSEQEEGRTGAQEHDLTHRARQLFDDSVQGLDGETLSRLNRARQQALDGADSPGGFQSLSPWVPAAGVAAAAVFAVMLWNGEAPVDEVTPSAMEADFEILMNADSLEMLEDLEFYSWLDLDSIDTDENVG